MITNLPMLSVLIFLPAFGAFFIHVLSFFFKKQATCIAKWIGLSTSLITLVLACLVWVLTDSSSANISGFKLIEHINRIDSYDISYALGVDGISIFFVLLTAFIVPICILCSWNSIKARFGRYVVLFLVMETTVIGTFCALDLFLFYIFFEAVLIPMYFIIGIWGGKDRVYAAYKFFLYTLAGSVFLLISIVYIYFQAGTTFIPDLNYILPRYGLDVQKLLWLGFFASFAVKVPMWPVHTWLPDAHVQAPTAGSVILAGILLKLGGYGFIRFSIPFFPAASAYFADFIFWLSIIAVIYTSLVALMQKDMKKLIAYSSIAHMGIVTAGLFTFTQQGIEGAIFQMISHGIVSAALFICVGIVYDRMHTKDIAFYSGLTSVMPKYAFHFMIFMLASIGLPATSGFIGEVMVLIGAFRVNKAYCALLATGMVLGAAYMLWLYARVMFGKINNPALQNIKDLTCFEKISLWPITVLIIIIGVYPSILLNGMHVDVNALIEKFNKDRVSLSVSDTVSSADNIYVIGEEKILMEKDNRSYE
jgi:NADH-quinone oxidoreductase subunit M